MGDNAGLDPKLGDGTTNPPRTGASTPAGKARRHPGKPGITTPSDKTTALDLTGSPRPSQEQCDAFAAELATAMEAVHEVVYRAAAAGLTPGEILGPETFLLSRSLGFTECLPDDLVLPRHASEAINGMAATLGRDADVLLADAAPALLDRIRRIGSGTAGTLTIPTAAEAQLREVAAVLGIDPQELADLFLGETASELADPESGMLFALIEDAGLDDGALKRFKAWCAAKGLRPDRFQADIEDAIAERQSA